MNLSELVDRVIAENPDAVKEFRRNKRRLRRLRDSYSVKL